jgi:hypothetical protein
MSIYLRFLNEVAQPNNEDELNFKQKHIIKHFIEPNANETQFTADEIKRIRNRADYEPGEDVDVYESRSLRFEPHVDLDDEDEDEDERGGDSEELDQILGALKRSRQAEINHKIIYEDEVVTAKAVDPAGGPWDEEESHNLYKLKMRKGPKDITGEPLEEDEVVTAKAVDPEGGPWDEEESHNLYKLKMRKGPKDITGEPLAEEEVVTAKAVDPEGGPWDEEESHNLYKLKMRKGPKDITGEPLAEADKPDAVDSLIAKTYEDLISECTACGCPNCNVTGTQAKVDSVLKRLSPSNRYRLQKLMNSNPANLQRVLDFANKYN